MTTATARSALRILMAQEVKLYGSGTCTAAGTTTTAIDTTRRKERDDYWNGSQLLKTGGTGSGEIGDVTDFVQSTSVLTHAQTLTATDTTTTYDLYRPTFKIVDYNAALTAALDEAYALGFGRRGWDETLYTTQQDRYAMPTALNEVAEVLETGPNSLYDPAWFGSGAGWTLHANASFGNNGDNQERTLNHLSTGADHYSTMKVAVTPGVEYAFRVRAISVLSTPVAVARYQFVNSAGALLGSATNFGTSSTAASALITGSFIAPVGAFMVQIGLGSSSASGTVRFYEHNLWVNGQYTQLPHSVWDIEWSNLTPYLVFKGQRPHRDRTLILKGRRVLETLTADTDTVGFGVPESRAFINLALAVLWEQTIGQVPNIDRGQAQENAGFRRAKFHELGKGFFDEWRQNRTISVPTYG